MNDILINIRFAKIEDSTDISRLSQELGYQSNNKQTRKRLETIIKSDDNAVFVATKPNSEIVGWIHVFQTQRVESDSFGEIGGLIVSEQEKSNGIGSKLIDVAETWLNQNDICKLRVRSQVKRKKAHKFYSKLGFIKEKEQIALDKQLK